MHLGTLLRKIFSPVLYQPLHLSPPIVILYVKNAMNPAKINRSLPALYESILYALRQNVVLVADKCKKLGTSPQEPDFIAGLVLYFTRDLYNILTKIFSQNRFSVTGVYCHQKPIVDIGTGKSPELGDILFVYIYTAGNGTKRYNSLLFQAKKVQRPDYTVPTADSHQLALYTGWPRFTYQRAGRLNGQARDIIPKAVNDGAQYLLIDDHPLHSLAGLPGTFPMGCAVPASTIYLDRDLSMELIDFLKFKAGRSFEADPLTSTDDWTKMIWELLAITRDKASSRLNAGLSNFPRQLTERFDGCCFITTQPNSFFSSLERQLRDGGERPVFENFNDEANVSPSLVLIESLEEG